MGLDTVELVMAIEDEFGICISDGDAEKMTTPGHVADYVMTLIRSGDNQACPSQIGFYRIRSLLMNDFSIPRKVICPNALMQELLIGDIKENWKKLRRALQAPHLPRLQRTNTLCALVFLVAPAIIVFPLLKTGVGLPLTVISYVLSALTANALTLTMGTIVPSKCQNVDALIRYVSCASTIRWTREEALAKIIEITGAQLGVPVEKIRENSHFVHDLGAN